MKKTTVFVILSLVLVGCGSGQEKDKSEAAASKSQPVEASSDNIELAQHGNYSSLFIREENDCNVTSADGIAKALQIQPINVTREEQRAGICRFIAILNSGTNVLVTLRYFKIPKDHVKSEIKNGIKNPDFYQVNISDTGDAYLITRGLGGQVQIFNTNYAGAVEIKTIESIKNSPPKHTEESRKQRYEEAVRIANYIVTNHQK